MKHVVKTLVLASAMAAMSGAAQAETAILSFAFSDSGDHTLDAFGYEIGATHGSGTLNFSERLLGALSIANITTSALEPGQLSETANTLAVTAPFFSLSGEFDSDTLEFTTQSVRIRGGALMTASALLPNGNNNTVTTGGSLSITNLRVDLTTQGIYATLKGANGVGTQNNVLVWNYGAIEGPTTFGLSVNSYPYGPSLDYLVYIATVRNTLSELTITHNAFDLFAQSLGLTALGKSAMAGVTDYGTISLVPEPSSYVLMGLGLVGLAFASRRARRA